MYRIRGGRVLTWQPSGKGRAARSRCTLSLRNSSLVAGLSTSTFHFALAAVPTAEVGSSTNAAFQPTVHFQARFVDRVCLPRCPVLAHEGIHVFDELEIGSRNVFERPRTAFCISRRPFHEFGEAAQRNISSSFTIRRGTPCGDMPSPQCRRSRATSGQHEISRVSYFFGHGIVCDAGSRAYDRPSYGDTAISKTLRRKDLLVRFCRTIFPVRHRLETR